MRGDHPRPCWSPGASGLRTHDAAHTGCFPPSFPSPAILPPPRHASIAARAAVALFAVPHGPEERRASERTSERANERTSERSTVPLATPTLRPSAFCQGKGRCTPRRSVFLPSRLRSFVPLGEARPRDFVKPLVCVSLTSSREPRPSPTSPPRSPASASASASGVSSCHPRLLRLSVFPAGHRGAPARPPRTCTQAISHATPDPSRPHACAPTRSKNFWGAGEGEYTRRSQNLVLLEPPTLSPSRPGPCSLRPTYGWGSGLPIGHLLSRIQWPQARERPLRRVLREVLAHDARPRAFPCIPTSRVP